MSSISQLMAQLGDVVHRIDHVAEPVDRGEVLRYLGYPAGVEPSATLRTMLDEWIPEAANRAEPRATYWVLPVKQLESRRLTVQAADGHDVEFQGAIGEFLAAAECVAVFIATAGPAVEQLASELMQSGDPLAGMIANAVGAERAEAAEAVVIDELRTSGLPFDFAPTLPYSPGYCGMALTEQRTLFGLFEGCDTHVTLTESYLMRPLKSVSGLIGLGQRERVQAFGSPCDRCELYNCSMRR